MENLDSSVAQRIARAAVAFQQQRTAHKPKSVAVVLGDTLLITLHGALSQAEKALAQSPVGAAQVQEFHRQLFANSANAQAEASAAHARPGNDVLYQPNDRSGDMAPEGSEEDAIDAEFVVK